MADLTFDEPEGFVPPENLDSDDTFQAMATFKVVPGNKLQLVDIEGFPLGEEEGETPEQEQTETEAGEPAAAGGVTTGADRLAAGAGGTQTAGYAERLGQMLRTRMAQAERAGRRR